MIPTPILAIDHGLQYLGLAISRSGQLASPLQVLKRKSKAEDFAQLRRVIQQEQIQSLVVGLPPIPPDFVGHSQSDTVRHWVGYLAQAIALPIYFWEEGLTTEDAISTLREQDKPIPKRVDAHAAAIILQTCLDAIHEQGAEPERFLPPPDPQS
jgi:putative Holliday junction resolvase